MNEFLWIATTNTIGCRDIDEVFLTRESAEKYAESEIKRCEWKIENIEKFDSYTCWTCSYSNGDIFVEIYVSEIPFNNY